MPGWSRFPLHLPGRSEPLQVAVIGQHQGEGSISFTLWSRVPKNCILAVVEYNCSVVLCSESIGAVSLARGIGLPNNIGWYEVGRHIDDEVAVVSESGQVVLVGRDDGSSDGCIRGFVRRLVVECILSKSNRLSSLTQSSCYCRALLALEPRFTRPLNIGIKDIFWTYEWAFIE